MDVTITARHAVLTESIRRHVEGRLGRLARFETRIVAAEVNLDVEHGVHHAEARLIVAAEPAIMARGEGQGFRSAVDRATDRLRRQLKSRRERRLDHQATTPSHRLSPAGGV